jgi:BirA family biotin operon repressor/biotin-[acetyl-CoA-carboxylase] ligase
MERRVEETPSTNDLAFELAASGCPEGTVVVAQVQSAGRGRMGRRWFSVKGGSLTFSIVLRPQRDRREWPELSLVCAGGVAEAVREIGVQDVLLKSPNDVMAGGGKKIAGILLESRVTGERRLVVAGIGMNVNIRNREFPGELRATASSLHEILGRKQETEEILSKVFRSLDQLYAAWQRGGADPVRSRLKKKGIVFVGPAQRS